MRRVTRLPSPKSGAGAAGLGYGVLSTFSKPTKFSSLASTSGIPALIVPLTWFTTVNRIVGRR